MLDEADDAHDGFAEDDRTHPPPTPWTPSRSRCSRRPYREHRQAGAAVFRIRRRSRSRPDRDRLNITQRPSAGSHQRKLDALTRFLEVEQFDAMIVFVRTKQATEEFIATLARDSRRSRSTATWRRQQRERTINQLKNGTIDILVATDVARPAGSRRRPDIARAVNFDIPHDTESYVHRIVPVVPGALEQCVAVRLAAERHLLRAIEKATRSTLTEIGLPSVEDVTAQRAGQFAESITGEPRLRPSRHVRKLIERTTRATTM